MKTTTTLLATLALTGTTAYGADLLVPSAYPTIQDAIDAAVDGDRVMIAPDTYNEIIDFLGKQITVRSEDRDPETVTIDGTGLNWRVVRFSGVSTSDARLIGVTVTGGINPTSSNGGGIRVDDGDPYILRCIIRGNDANVGGGIFLDNGNPVIGHCLIYDNTSNGAGSGLYLDHGNPTITNCVFASNLSNVYGVLRLGDNATMRNCIVADNVGPDMIQESSVGLLDAQYCNIQDGWPGTGNIDASPGFIDAANRDYRLGEGSPCIDAGDNDAVNAILDLAFLPRKLSDPYTPDTGNGNGNGPIVDMGAYEYPSRVRFVNDDATGAGTGLTWEDAYPDLVDAIEDAVAIGSGVTELWVAAGTYHPDRGTGDRNQTFHLWDGMTWFGGFVGDETSVDDRDPRAHETILSGDIGGPGTADNSYNVVSTGTVNTTGTIDGLVVERGRADGAYGGGGLLLGGAGSTCTVRNCWIRLNEQSDSLTGGGAGVYCTFAATSVFEHTRISQNAGTQGGGVCVDDGSAVFVNCVIAGNASNDASWAAGVDVDAADVELRSCTVYGNANTGGAPGGVRASLGSLSVASSILWSNTGSSGAALEQNYAAAGTVETSYYSTIEGAGFDFGDEGNSGLDPSFVDLDGANGVLGDADDQFDLRVESHAIDSGHNAAVLGYAVDFLGQPRRFESAGMPDSGIGAGAIVDRGAVEFQAPGCAFDLDGDASVGFNDLTILLGTWGDTGGDPTGDYLPAGGDGSLGFDELVNLLGTWGPCPIM